MQEWKGSCAPSLAVPEAGLEQPGTVGGVPGHGRGLEPDKVRSLPTQTIPWFQIPRRSVTSMTQHSRSSLFLCCITINTSQPATGISWRRSSALSPVLGPHWAPRNFLNAPCELSWGLPFFSFFNQRISPSGTARGTFWVEPALSAAAAFVAEAEEELCLLSWDLHRNQAVLSKKKAKRLVFLFLKIIFSS